jgi:hypothetical protein
LGQFPVWLLEGEHNQLQLNSRLDDIGVQLVGEKVPPLAGFISEIYGHFIPFLA